MEFRREHIRSGVNMVQVKVNMNLLHAQEPTFTDFHRHGPGENVPAGEILRRWGIALHKALTLGIGEISTLPARTFCDEHAGAVNPGRMELHEFHVLQWQASAQHHAAAVSSARMRGRRGEIAATIAAGCQNDLIGAETMDRTVLHADRDHTPPSAISHVTKTGK